MDDKGISIEGIGTKGPYHVDEATKEMSVSHHQDTVEYNLRHAEDHLKAAMDACKKLHEAGEKVPTVPKTLLSVFDYFEKKENAASMPMDKLRDKIK